MFASLPHSLIKDSFKKSSHLDPSRGWRDHRNSKNDSTVGCVNNLGGTNVNANNFLKANVLLLYWKNPFYLINVCSINTIKRLIDIIYNNGNKTNRKM